MLALKKAIAVSRVSETTLIESGGGLLERLCDDCSRTSYQAATVHVVVQTIHGATLARRPYQRRSSISKYRHPPKGGRAAQHV